MTNSPRQTAGLGGGWHTASQGGWGAPDFQEKWADSWGGEGGVRGGGFEREALTRAWGRACLPWTSAPRSVRGAPSCVALSQFLQVRTERPSGGTTSAPLASRGWAVSRPHWAPQAGQLGCQEAALLTQKFRGAPHQCPKQAMPAGSLPPQLGASSSVALTPLRPLAALPWSGGRGRGHTPSWEAALGMGGGEVTPVAGAQNWPLGRNSWAASLGTVQGWGS